MLIWKDKESCSPAVKYCLTAMSQKSIFQIKNFQVSIYPDLLGIKSPTKSALHLSLISLST